MIILQSLRSAWFPSVLRSSSWWYDAVLLRVSFCCDGAEAREEGNDGRWAAGTLLYGVNHGDDDLDGMGRERGWRQNGDWRREGWREGRSLDVFFLSTSAASKTET